MSVFIAEIEFGLSFEQESFIVPFEVKDSNARIEAAYAKIGQSAAGTKETIGAILVRDRMPVQIHPPLPPMAQFAIVVHRIGPIVDLPESAGTLVGSFSSHQGRHQWHVFAPKKDTAAPKPTARPGASRAPKAASAETDRDAPDTAPSLPLGQGSTSESGSAPRRLSPDPAKTDG
jgi:hypothetical protein